MKLFITIISLSAIAIFASCNSNKIDTQQSDIPYFAWMDTVGARSYPTAEKNFVVNDFGARGDAVTNCTEAIQKAIDAAVEAGGGRVTFEPGMYLIGSIFVGENVNLEIPRGTTLLGSNEISDYQRIATRVAGIEMTWPAALLNIVGVQNAAISGSGIIDARGRVFWEKYFAMRHEYEPKGLRWIVDYDCERPRGILISNSRDVTVSDIVLYRAGFWSLHVLYSQSVTIDNIIIDNNIEMRGPSTDGIDIDSSSSVLVQNCSINCNDDNFCLKAGRDADGLRVNRPCEYVVIRNCTAGKGDGLFTCGSETSGGIRHIVAYGLKARGTNHGLRFKSTCQRGGTIEDIYIADIQMDSVKRPILVDLNWNPSYSTSLLPEGYNRDELPAHWLTMLQEVLPEQGTPKFRDIHFSNISAVGAQKCINAVGIEQSTLDNFTFKNVSLEGREKGKIEFDNDWDDEGLTIIFTNN